jgi:hypothetical protein
MYKFICIVSFILLYVINKEYWYYIAIFIPIFWGLCVLLDKNKK